MSVHRMRVQDRDRIRIMRAIAELRKVGTPNAVAGADSIEEYLNGIPEKAASLATTTADGRPCVVEGRTFDRTEGFMRHVRDTLLTSCFVGGLLEQLRAETELAHIPKLMYSQALPRTEVAQ